MSECRSKSEKINVFLKGRFPFIFFISLLLITLSFNFSLSRLDGYELGGNIYEENVEKVDDLTATITFIIIVLSLVITLLYLGGFLKFRGLDFRFGKYFPLLSYIGLIIFIFILPILQRFGYIHIFPDNPDEILKRKEFEGFRQIRLPHGICLFFKYLNVSEMVACYIPAFIYFFLLPFAAIYTIVWSLLKQLKLFSETGRQLEALIAFIITFMSLPMGSLSFLVAFSFTIAGALSIAVFISMVLVGIFSIGFKDVSKRYQEIAREISKDFETRSKNIVSEAKHAIRKILEAGNVDGVEDALRRFENMTGLFIPAEKRESALDAKDLVNVKLNVINCIKDAIRGNVTSEDFKLVEGAANEAIRKLSTSKSA